MSVLEVNSLLGLVAFSGFVAYWLRWSHKDQVPMAGSLAKAGSVALLAVLAGMAGLWPVALGLTFGAIGDFALSRRGQAAFLAGMAAFALGHLAYAAAFWRRAMPVEALAYWPFALLLALLSSTEFWLASHTGDLRWPVRGYVMVICIMAALAMTLAPAAGRGVIRFGVGLFLASDLLLALRMFVVTDPPQRRALSLVLWPAYWLGQVLILLGSLTYWPSSLG